MIKKKVDLNVGGLELVDAEVARALRPMLQKIIKGAFLEGVTVSITFMNDDDIRALNRKFRKMDKATDVLSFATSDGEFVIGSDGDLGDIVISVETAKKQADEFRHGLLEEIAVLATHGLAHLLGFDHERGEDDERMQAEWEMAVLDIAGISPKLALAARFHTTK